MASKIKIPFMAFWVGTKCTLRCKHCCNLIPYVKQISYDFDKSMAAFKRLIDIADIQSLQLQGGEPFSHPRISEFINEVSGGGRLPFVIATNGVATLGEKVIKSLQENPNAEIRISNYECSEKVRSRFIKKLEENRIAYTLYDCRYHDNTWFNSGGSNEEKIIEDDAMKKIYADCTNKRCFALAEGILSVCGKIHCIGKLQGENYTDGIVDFNKDISSEILKEDLQIFLAESEKFKEACRYCQGTYGRVPAGIQL